MMKTKTTKAKLRNLFDELNSRQDTAEERSRRISGQMAQTIKEKKSEKMK